MTITIPDEDREPLIRYLIHEARIKSKVIGNAERHRRTPFHDMLAEGGREDLALITRLRTALEQAQC